MNKYVSKQIVKIINQGEKEKAKAFAIDLIYSDNRYNDMFTELLTSIYEQYESSDKTPSILEIKEDNITENTIIRIQKLDPKSLYVQVNNKVLQDTEKVNILRKLKESGYKFVVELNIDDIAFTLAKVFANIVKIDIKNIPPAFNFKTNKFNCKTLVYNVNSEEDYLLAESSGMALYEGNYVKDSTKADEVIDSTKHSKINFVEVIALIQKQDTDIKVISSVIERDSLMSSQLIKLANSAYFGRRGKTNSVKDAIVRLGVTNLKKWVFLLEFSRDKKVPEELLEQSYQRALFSQEVISSLGNIRKEQIGVTEEDAYLIGLFSTLDILTGRSMTSELKSMNLSETVTEALIYREGNGGKLLNLVKAYEEKDLKRVDKISKLFELNGDRLYRMYLETVEKAQNTWKNLSKLNLN